MSSTPNLAEILANAGDGLSIFDRDRNVTFTNVKASELLRHADTHFHKQISRAVVEQSSIRFDSFHAGLNGWFEHQTYPNSDGGLTVFSREVTSRHRLEEALRHSEERFRRVIESNIIGVAVGTGEVVAEANDVFLNMIGYTRTELVTQQIRWREFSPAEFDEVDEGAARELQRNGVFAAYEKQFVRRDGSRVSVMISGVATRIEPFELLCLVVDLTKRKHAEEENTRLYHEAQRANRLKDEFVAIVSHELRTPLTPILGGVYMLRSEPQDERLSARALDLIERNAKALVKIVDDLLDTSRIITGKLKLNTEIVDLASVIDAALESVRPASDAKDINLEVRLNRLRGLVLADPDRLQQVIWNLLANAVKFTAPGGSITVELRESDTEAEIRITDTGIGIEPDFLPHVFDRFRQANATRTRVHGGLGLGLAIVRHLVESHGGTVNVASSGTDRGATFAVCLPIRSIRQVAGS
jgi:PAS domain S-box-containing protein